MASTQYRSQTSRITLLPVAALKTQYSARCKRLRESKRGLSTLQPKGIHGDMLLRETGIYPMGSLDYAACSHDLSPQGPIALARPHSARVGFKSQRVGVVRPCASTPHCFLSYRSVGAIKGKRSPLVQGAIDESERASNKRSLWTERKCVLTLCCPKRSLTDSRSACMKCPERLELSATVDIRVSWVSITSRPRC